MKILQEKGFCIEEKKDYLTSSYTNIILKKDM